MCLFVFAFAFCLWNAFLIAYQYNHCIPYVNTDPNNSYNDKSRSIISCTIVFDLIIHTSMKTISIAVTIPFTYMDCIQMLTEGRHYHYCCHCCCCYHCSPSSTSSLSVSSILLASHSLLEEYNLLAVVPGENKILCDWLCCDNKGYHSSSSTDLI